MSQDKTFRKKQTIAMLVLILFIALALRWETVNQPRDFWIDESYQYAISQQSVSFILDSPDVHPPLFNLFTKFLLTIGIENPFTLRLVMVFLSLIFIGVFFFTVKEIFNRNTAFYSSIILSSSLTYIYYATEFRSYTFTLIFVILQIKYFNRILNFKDFDMSLLWLSVFSALMIYSHYMAGLILIAQMIFLALNRKKIRIEKQTAYFSSLVILFFFSLPLMFYIIKTLPKIQSFWFKDIDFTSFISTFSYILAPPFDYSILFFLVYPFIFFIIRIDRDKFNIKAQQFFYYLFIPVILMWAISQLFPFYHHRYFLFGGLSIFVLLGWCLDRLDKHQKDLGVFFMSIWFVIIIFTFSPFIATFDTELLESSIFLENITDNETTFIHSTTFSALPYKVYFPNEKHYIVTNLIEDNLFTCGGSVFDYKNQVFNDIKSIPQNNKSYWVSDKKLTNRKTIYSKDGLIIQEIN